MELDYFVGEHGVVVLRSHLLGQALRGLAGDEHVEARRAAVRDHIAFLESDEHKARLTIRDVDPAWTWFNTERPLSLHTDLRGKVVVLDFFTYCCANCLHILPDLEKLEQAYTVADGLVVVGVHSAKFENERRDASIADAVRRYHIQHPVVNDAKLALWQALNIRSWPSLAVLGPEGNLLLLLSGEGHAIELDLFVREALTHYATVGTLSSKSLPLVSNSVGVHGDGGSDGAPTSTTAVTAPTTTTLSYPGKVAIDEAGGRLFVADTAHHRLVIAQLSDGTVLDTVGRAGERGAADGSYDAARLNSPNGLAYADGRLYVADTENHTVRVIDLDARTVVTLAGTGSQGSDYAGGRAGRAQPLSTPWDLVYQPARAGSDTPARLLVAMAGIHQIWTVDLPTAVTQRYAGSGAEANRNSADPKVTAFAQPSGLALGGDGAALYIADSESSAVRVIGAGEKFYARGVCGGLKSDPSNLFAFGDVDGKGDKARLQHPLGVLFVPGTVWGTEGQDVLVVADTYNHRLKVVRHPIDQGETARWSGVGGAAVGGGPVDGPADVATFAEPSGLALDAARRRVLVADTNHHAIRIVHIPDGRVETLALKFPEAPPAAPAKRLADKRAKHFTFEVLPTTLAPGHKGTLAIQLHLPEHLHITPMAPSSYHAVAGGPLRWGAPLEGDLMDWSTVENAEESHVRDATVRIPFEVAGGAAAAAAEVDFAFYYCSDRDGACFADTATLTLRPSTSTSSAPSSTSASDLVVDWNFNG